MAPSILTTCTLSAAFWLSAFWCFLVQHPMAPKLRNSWFSVYNVPAAGGAPPPPDSVSDDPLPDEFAIRRERSSLPQVWEEYMHQHMGHWRESAIRLQKRTPDKIPSTMSGYDWRNLSGCLTRRSTRFGVPCGEFLCHAIIVSRFTRPNKVA